MQKIKFRDHPVSSILQNVETCDRFIADLEDKNQAGVFARGSNRDELVNQLLAILEYFDNKNLLQNVGQAVFDVIIEFRERLMKGLKPYRKELIKLGVITEDESDSE